jgi:hypothetical protein
MRGQTVIRTRRDLMAVQNSPAPGSPTARKWTWRSPWLLAAALVLVYVAAAAGVCIARPGATPTAGGDWLTVNGVQFRVVSAELAAEYDGNLPENPGHQMLIVDFGFAGSDAQSEAWDELSWDGYVTDNAGTRSLVTMGYAELGTAVGSPANDTVTKASWVFEVPADARGFVLHFSDGQAVSLESYLGD